MRRRQNSSDSSISTDESDQSSDKPSQKNTLKRKSSQRNESNSDSSDTSDCTVIKKVASTDIQPVVLQSKNEKPLRSYNPIAIDRCLIKAIGQYENCKPLQNGNLIVNCKTSNQVSTLLQMKSLKDSLGTNIPVLASLVQPIGAKGVIYNVPTNIKEDQLLNCLSSQNVKFVKRFSFKSITNETQPSTSVFLQFHSNDLPSFVKIEQMLLKPKIYIPKPLRCFKCHACHSELAQSTRM